MDKPITCIECQGKGELPAYSHGATTPTEVCPWCQGLGTVPLSFVVRCYGHNGDFSFGEVWDVTSNLATAKELAEKGMRSDRYANTLEDGTPTILGFEISGSDGTLIHLDNENANYVSA